MLISEALLLLALDDEKGTFASGSWLQLDTALGGALVLDLVMRRRLDVSGDAEPAALDGTPMKPGRLLVRDGALTGHPVLDGVLQRLAEVVGKKVAGAIPVAAKGARTALLEHLGEAGLISRDRRKVWGLFPRAVWPTVDERPERELRDRVLAVLDGGAEPDEATGHLVSVIHTAGLLPALFPTPDKAQRATRADRAKGIATTPATGEWAVAATTSAVQATLAGVAAAVTVSTVSTIMITH